MLEFLVCIKGNVFIKCQSFSLPCFQSFSLNMHHHTLEPNRKVDLVRFWMMMVDLICMKKVRHASYALDGTAESMNIIGFPFSFYGVDVRDPCMSDW